MRHFFLTTILILLSVTSMYGVGNPVDTLRIEEILSRAASLDLPASKLATAIAKEFIDTPYASGTLEVPGPERLVIRLDSLDCTTFVETVSALAITATRGKRSWRDFADTLRQLRYRGGMPDGYASRRHYFSDWLLGNSFAGLFSDATSGFPAVDYAVKSLDFMSTHRDAYPALADEDVYRAIRRVEDGFRSYRFPYIKKVKIVSDPKTLACFREGDIVALVSDIPGLDVSHEGFITIVDGTPHLLHASSKEGRVMIDPLPLSTYFKRSKKLSGLRVARFVDL